MRRVLSSAPDLSAPPVDSPVFVDLQYIPRPVKSFLEGEEDLDGASAIDQG